MLTGLSALKAPAHWQQIEFISDLHLSESDPVTFGAWQDYMQACTADALFILGDLFEAWIGDDVLTTPKGFAFEKSCAKLLATCARTRPVYFLHGNRDFLLGEAFFKATGVQALADPCGLELGAERLLLSHGDALCVNDVAYMQLRSVIRTPQWQQSTLAKPLLERQAMAEQIKMDKALQHVPIANYMDVDEASADQWLSDHRASILIHGHTHLPAAHVLASGGQRIVLSDWEGRHNPPRAEVLRWQEGIWLRLSPAQSTGKS